MTAIIQINLFHSKFINTDITFIDCKLFIIITVLLRQYNLTLHRINTH